MRGFLLLSLFFFFEIHAESRGAFALGKIQLNGGSLYPRAASDPHRVISKAGAGFPLLVLLDKKCLSEDPSKFLRRLGFVAQHNSSAGLSVEAVNVRFDGSDDVVALEQKLAVEKCIKGVTENPRVENQAVSDPLYESQPALPAISQLPGERFFFHAIYGIRADTIVGVIDSGAELSHPDLISRLWRGAAGETGFDFVNDDSDPSDDFGHGTHVAGIIGAQRDNGTGIRGVMGEWSKIMPVKTQDGFGGGTMADVINGFRWAVDHGAEVVNLSLASRQANQALADALEYAVLKNVTVVVAAGNDGEQISSGNFISPVGYAAGLPGVIGVGSVDADSKNRSGFSNFGANVVEIAAPGSAGNSVGILSSYLNGRYSSMNGTSMSAPHVAGAAALVTGFLKTRAVQYTPASVEEMILTSADHISANEMFFTEGRSLNLENLGRYLFNSTIVNSTGGFDDP